MTAEVVSLAEYKEQLAEQERQRAEREARRQEIASGGFDAFFYLKTSHPVEVYDWRQLTEWVQSHTTGNMVIKEPDAE